MEWKEIKPPRWVKKATNRYYDKCSVRPYDIIIHFKGKHFIYKVWFETIGQAQIKKHYYKKKRKGRWKFFFFRK